MSATSRIVRVLESATRAAKCHKCGCFQDAVATLEDSALAGDLAAVLAAARAAFEQREYDCIGCKVCWPADALNAAAEVTELPAHAGCPTEVPERRQGWPPYPGDYHVLRFAAPVAVCTLHSRDTVDAVTAVAPEGLSIVGALQTENLGIERLVENVVGNPHVRTLLLCGEDTPGRVGHFPGQSLIALVDNGVDDQMRIVGAHGKRPVLCNLSAALVDRFRAQIEVLDHRGETGVPELARLVEQAAARARGPMESAAGTERSVRVLAARPPERLVLDPAGYVVVIPDRRRGVLVAEHYENSGVLHTVVEGDDPSQVIATLLAHELVTRTDHAAYLGRQLALADRALREGLPFVQDRAPDAVPDPPVCGCQPPRADESNPHPSNDDPCGGSE